MSINYSFDVANIGLWTLIKILLKWRGSLYRIVWPEAFLITCFHFLLSILYQYIMFENESALLRRIFHFSALLMSDTYKYLPIEFVLGFYVSSVVSRWYEQMACVPFIDDLAIITSTYIDDSSEDANMLRRTIIRYSIVSYILAGSVCFKPIHDQFPTYKHLVHAGLLSEEELERLENTEVPEGYGKYFVAANWVQNLAVVARQKKYIKYDRLFDHLVDKIANFRGSIGGLFIVDYVNPPLVYTQMTGFLLYFYILGSMFSSQLDIIKREAERSMTDILLDIIQPFNILTYLFYFGWYKAAESLINPFGYTDNDFDIVYSPQRDLQVGLLFVDQLHAIRPPMIEIFKNEPKTGLDMPFEELYINTTMDAENTLINESSNLSDS